MAICDDIILLLLAILSHLLAILAHLLAVLPHLLLLNISCPLSNVQPLLMPVLPRLLIKKSLAGHYCSLSHCSPSGLFCFLYTVSSARCILLSVLPQLLTFQHFLLIVQPLLLAFLPHLLTIQTLSSLYCSLFSLIGLFFAQTTEFQYWRIFLAVSLQASHRMGPQQI